MSEQEDKKRPSALRKKVPALGRGLAALLGDNGLMPGASPAEPRPGERVIQVPVERLEPNPFQPRRIYQPQALKALADSIAEHGLLQPILVRPAGEGYQLIAGERRLRASQMAGLSQVPVVVRRATDEQTLLLALLENLQREDLNPMEEAAAYQRLAQDFSLSQEEIAAQVGKDRSTVANLLRLLKLPGFLQKDVAEGTLSAGHGRALLSLDSEAKQRKARENIVKKGLSVRAAESMVKSMLKPARPKTPGEVQAYLNSLAEDLAKNLGTKVNIRRRGKKGSITIEFYSDQELERLLAILG